MCIRNREVLAAVLVAGLLAAPAMADINLSYLGAFKLASTTATTNMYGGDIAYYPSGNGGAGSLFVSRGTANTGTGVKEIVEVPIPALVNTTDVNALNAATPLQGFDTAMNPAGMTWRSTDDKLYLTRQNSTSLEVRSINRDGTGESAMQTTTFASTGGDVFQVPDAWAATYAGGRNLVSVGGLYGIRMQAIDPWNTPMAAPKGLVAYDATHPMTGYDYNDAFSGATWVTAGSESYVIVSGKDNSAGAATLWFYNASDIANATQTYQPQPFKTLVVQDKLFDAAGGAKEIWGLTYDAQHQIVYGYEGAYQKPTVVHAWAVPEPATMTLVLLGAVAAMRRGRKN